MNSVTAWALHISSSVRQEYDIYSIWRTPDPRQNSLLEF